MLSSKEEIVLRRGTENISIGDRSTSRNKVRAELLDSQAHDPFQIVLSDEEQLLSETSQGGLENFRQISRFQPYFFSSSSSYPRYLVPYFKIFFQFSDILVVVVRFFGVFAKIKKKDRSPRSFKRSNGIVKLRTSSFHTTHLVWGILSVRNF